MLVSANLLSISLKAESYRPLGKINGICATESMMDQAFSAVDHFFFDSYNPDTISAASLVSSLI